MRGATKRAAASSAAFCLAMGGIPLAACRLLPAGLPAGASAAAVYLIALAVGLHSIPKLADAMLARKLEGWLDWFDRGAAAYSAWRGKEPIREPNPGSKDSDERKLAAWRKDVATQAASGSLPRELFDEAAAAGVPFAESIDPASLPGMDALEAKYGPSASAATSWATKPMPHTMAVISKSSAAVRFFIPASSFPIPFHTGYHTTRPAVWLVFFAIFRQKSRSVRFGTDCRKTLFGELSEGPQPL